MQQRVRKLVLPVAGMGKRLRPLTNRRPKALVPVNGGPLLEYACLEAEQSGIRDVVLVVNPQHERNFAAYIKRNAKRFHLRFHIRVQKQPLGDGHAVFQVMDLLTSREPVAVRFCDDLLLDRKPILGSLMTFYDAHQSSLLLLERVPRAHVSRYGVVGVSPVAKRRMSLPRGKLHRITTLIEKPPQHLAPSNLTVVGGYVLSPEALVRLSRMARALDSKDHDALRLADVLRGELASGRKVYGWEFTGHRLDCGTLEGFYGAEAFLKKNFPHHLASRPRT